MKFNLLIFLLIMFSKPIFSQEKKEGIKKDELTMYVPENGKVENGIYICNRFDWKIVIPDGYEVTDLKIIEELENVGYKAIEKEMPKGIKIDKHPTQLIGFEKNKYNNFKASFESLLGAKKYTLEEHKKLSEQLLTDTYNKIKAVKFESTVSDLQLGDYTFYLIKTRVYDPKSDKLVLTQELYNSYINNHLFSALINYTDENEGMKLNYVFLKSFEK